MNQSINPKQEMMTVVRGAAVPQGMPKLTDFALRQEPMPLPAEGEVLFRTIYMSIDAAQRSFLPQSEDKPMVWPHRKIGDLMVCGKIPPLNGWTGGIVGEVIESRHPGFQAGDFVHGGHFWQSHLVMPGDLLAKLDPNEAPLTAQLGLLGQSGFVAWVGMELISKLMPGETFVIAGAGGSIGMIAGQLAKLAGARVIGIASGEKCKYVTETLGFDACIDRSTSDVRSELDRLCPNGVDVYFENVGGDISRAVFDRLKPFGRVVVCGAASNYGDGGDRNGGLPSLIEVLGKNLTIQGFVVYDFYEHFDTFRRKMLELLAHDKINFRHEIINGLDKAPQALIDLALGLNKGKFIVRVGDDPTL